jgi:hypothetical protein
VLLVGPLGVVENAPPEESCLLRPADGGAGLLPRLPWRLLPRLAELDDDDEDDDDDDDEGRAGVEEADAACASPRPPPFAAAFAASVAASK